MQRAVPTYCLALLAFAAMATDVSGQTPPASLSPPEVNASPQTKVVVLHNGNVLVGEVDHLGDAYRVATGTTEIRLSVREVERVVGSLLEAYDAKRAAWKIATTDEHLRLAAWCIRQEMWPQAALELNNARQRERRHPSIALLQRRLQVASRAAMRASEPLPLLKPDPKVKHEAEEKRASELQELESLAQSLPEGSFEDFNRHIQPILVNGCAVAGCHCMEDAQQLRLSRDLLRGLGNRESTLRNLQAVWGVVDLQSPHYSPLLTQPAVPHGGLSQPVFTGNRKRLQERLAEWVRVATQPSQADPTPTPTIELVTHELATHELGGPRLENRTPVAPEAESPHFWEVGPDGEPLESQVQRGLKSSQFKPKDEFDPEIFNRQQSAASVSESPEG